MTKNRRERLGAGDAFENGQNYSLADVDNQLFGGLQAADVQRVIVRPLTLASILVRPEIQVRLEGLNEDQVIAWTEAIETGTEFPPVVVFKDAIEGQEVYFLADGFHRLEAHRRAGKETVKAEIHPGGYEGAYEFAEEANLTHGQRLTSDSLKGVLFRRLKRDHEWATLSHRAIAEKMGVSHSTVKRWKEEYFSSTGLHVPVSVNTRTKNGQTMQTSGIQKANKKRAQKPPTPSKLKRKIISDLRAVSNALDQIEACEYAAQVDEWIDYLCNEWGIK